MDLQLLGTTGVITMDDFVLDWESSFAFKNPEIKAGYTFRTGMATRQDAIFVPTPTDVAQEVAMIEHFAELAASGDATKRARYAEVSLKTQEYLDALWVAAGARGAAAGTGTRARSGFERGGGIGADNGFGASGPRCSREARLWVGESSGSSRLIRLTSVLSRSRNRSNRVASANSWIIFRICDPLPLEPVATAVGGISRREFLTSAESTRILRTARG